MAARPPARRPAHGGATPALALALAALLALAAALFGGRPAEARDRAAHERAWAGRGALRPLAELLAVLERALPGRMIEADLDEEDGRPVYEIDWLLPDGRKLEVTLDARSGAWLKLEGPRLETAFRGSAPGGGGRP
ncbi:putative membrane protein [Piscinibacter sakaiensis]|uniref:Putative membrane protein n=1 Tax=Piscinibacter sakaiensis TaxID=1547922 RepID=A0A0K8NU56_PISS1|nr:putative membrane protein [Piscinibacter sakaiensis]